LGSAFSQVGFRTLVDSRRLDLDRLVQTYTHSGTCLSVVRDESAPEDARAGLVDAFQARAGEAEQREGFLTAETIWAPFVAREPLGQTNEPRGW
jgi:hypothetical protein